MKIEKIFLSVVLIIISSVYSHGESFKCPDKTFTENELSEIVKRERTVRKDLPQPFEKFKTKVIRLRCLYVFYEIPLPEGQEAYQTFTIDPYGEIMETYKNIPSNSK